MTVQGKDQGANWITEFLPAWRVPVGGYPYPGLLTLEVGLDVGLFGVGLLGAVAGKKAVGIAEFAGLHGRRRAGEFIENSRMAVGIPDTVAEENHSALELPILMI